MSTTDSTTGPESPCSTTAAKAAGALILVGYLAYGLPDALLVQPLLSIADPLAAVAGNSAQLSAGVLLMAINAAAVVGIALLLYPALARHDRTIALSYVATRLFEAILIAGGLVALLALVPLSEGYAGAGTADQSALLAVSAAAIQGNAVAFSVAMIGLGLGSLPFCYLLYRARLVPRVLALLGLVGYPALVAMMVVEVAGVAVGPALYALFVPGMLFELGLAGWLLVKGLDSSGLDAADAVTLGGEPTE